MAVFFICAGLLGLLAVVLTVHVGRMRGQKKIFLGDGGDPELTGGHPRPRQPDRARRRSACC